MTAYHRRAWFAIALVAISWPREARGQLADHLLTVDDEPLLGLADSLRLGPALPRAVCAPIAN